jgi:hypothetical protein
MILPHGSVLSEQLFAALRGEGGDDPNAQYAEKLNRLTAESWRKRAPWSLGSFQKRCFAEGFTA